MSTNAPKANEATYAKPGMLVVPIDDLEKLALDKELYAASEMQDKDNENSEEVNMESAPAKRSYVRKQKPSISTLHANIEALGGAPTRLSEGTKLLLKSLVTSFYSAQKLRISVGNRICANIRAKLGQAPGVKAEDGLEEDAANILRQIQEEYALVTDALTTGTYRDRLRALQVTDNGILTDPFELDLVEHYLSLKDNELRLERSIKAVVRTTPLWEHYLQHISQCGELMAACILSKMDPAKARHASSFWRYCGLDVVVGDDSQGVGRSARREHLVTVQYTDKNGELAEKLSLAYSQFMKAKIRGVMAQNFVQYKSQQYEPVYRNYKHRITNRPDLKDAPKGKLDGMAKRYMAKQFLADMWRAWRTLEGLPVSDPYHEAKLGMAPHGLEAHGREAATN